jgi:DNA-binding response OmpR family regulator
MSWTILIVEDDDDIIDTLGDIVRGRGFRVRQASNGATAIAETRARGERPDVILLDLMMPVMDGTEFLDTRAAEPLLAHVPVIVMSARQPIPSEVSNRVFDVVPKPTDLKQLLAAVEAHVTERHRSGAGDSSARSIRSRTVDPASLPGIEARR